jgi:IS1 family transposase
MIAALRVIIVVYFAKQVNVIRTDYWSSFRKITDQIHKQTTGKMKIIFPENSPSYR